jgi:hypothetical protein
LPIEEDPMEDAVWAEPKEVTDIKDCYFYHTMDIPGHGTVEGKWDLRDREAEYLGNVDLKGKRVLEMGTASGHLCFAMEKMGADVVGYDLSEKQDWDIVPYAGLDYEDRIAGRKEIIRQLNNGYWLAHKANGSKAKVLYGSIYEIPEGIGRFDICTFGSILLHLRDPFLAMQRVTAHVDKTVIVTDIVPRIKSQIIHIAELIVGGPLIRFLPDAGKCSPFESWWNVSPRLIKEFLKILGFTDTRITYHRQKFRNKDAALYTIVGNRK